ncbi:MAG: hypothetical protein ACYC35_14560 [Pirellulales bacterium]
MAQGRERAAWNRTAHLLAMIYNAHRSPKARIMKPAEFQPSAAKRDSAPKAKLKDLSILKAVFVRE